MARKTISTKKIKKALGASKVNEYLYLDTYTKADEQVPLDTLKLIRENEEVPVGWIVDYSLTFDADFKFDDLKLAAKKFHVIRKVSNLEWIAKNATR